jgi:hypothetical protein
VGVNALNLFVNLPEMEKMQQRSEESSEMKRVFGENGRKREKRLKNS